MRSGSDNVTIFNLATGAPHVCTPVDAREIAAGGLYAYSLPAPPLEPLLPLGDDSGEGEQSPATDRLPEVATVKAKLGRPPARK